MTTVVNLHKEEYDVYIGRPGKGKIGDFGNPFNSSDRESNINNFRKYFYQRISSDLEFKRKILQLKNKKLGCFCSPKPCHGQIIADYLNNLKPIKLAVIGSRSFNDFDKMQKCLKSFVIKKIISGGATGADSLAKEYSIKFGIPIHEFLPNWNLHGKSAGFKRNIQIIDESDEVIAFWDGKSKGTKHSIDYANSKNKPITIVYFFDNDQGFWELPFE